MRILLIDDHPVFRSGLESLLRDMEPAVEVLHAGSCEEGLRIARKRALNLAFLDLNLPDGNGLDCLKLMKEARPSLPVVLISGEQISRDMLERALDLRAMGFVPKSESAETIVIALRSALAGGVFLPAHLAAGELSSSPQPTRQDHGGPKMANNTGCSSAHPGGLGITRRQTDVLRYLVQGQPNKRIATKLDISVPVVKKHVSDLLAHFRVVSRTQLVALMAQRGVRFGPPELSDPADDFVVDEA